MPARRSWSQTEVRSAPKSRFAPLHSISRPADSVVDETSRDERLQQLSELDCRSTSPVACARSSASVNACPPKPPGSSASVDGSFSQPMTRTPTGFCIWASGTSTAGRVPRYSERAADDAGDIGDKMRLSVPEQGCRDHAGRPRMWGQVIDAERRGGLQGIAAAGDSGKEWSFGRRRRTRHGDGAPEAGRRAGPWPLGPETGWPRVTRR